MRKFTLLFAAAALSTSAAMAQTYTLNPAAGVAENLQGITLTFPTAKVGVYENNRMPVATLVNNTAGVTYYCETPDRNTKAETDGTEFKLMFIEENNDEAEEAITMPGDYTLTIRGLYTGELDNAIDVDVINVQYSIKYPAAYTLSPAAGVAKDLQGIVLTFTDTKVGFYDNNRMAAAVLENVTTGKVYNCETPDLNPKAETDGSQYTLVFVGEDDEEAPASINEPGDYVLTVRGMYAGEVDDDVALPVITAKYTVEFPYAYTLNPEAGVATNLQGIVLQFEDKGIGFYENNRMPIAVLENKTTGTEYNCYEPARNTFTTAGTEYVLNFYDEDDEYVAEINEPGDYVLTIRGMFYSNMTDETDDDVDLPVITAYYTVAYPVDYTLTPANGSTVEDLQNIVLSFPETFVGFYENNRMPVAVLENTTTGVTYNCVEPDRNTKAEAAAEYTFVFLDEDDEVAVLTQPGEYQLTIRGMYMGEVEEETDVILPVIMANYTIAYPVAYLLEPANEAVVSEITEVVVDFYENKNIGFVENSRMPIAVITNGMEGDEEVAFTCEAPVMDTKAESEGKVYTFKFLNADDEQVAINEPGLYYLTIRGIITFTINEDEEEEIDAYLPNIEAVYYVTDDEEEGDAKVVEITTENGLYNVYSINGTQVVKNGNVDSLKALGKGIYVVNGHKVVIR